MQSTKVKKHIDYWKKSAKRSWKTARGLFDIKRYDACLFFCHLTLEKALKSLVVMETEKLAPHIHDLDELALRAKIDCTEEQKQHFRTITTFNIAGRYDNVKLDFYKMCTRGYAKKYLDISNELFLWLKKQYKKD